MGRVVLLFVFVAGSSLTAGSAWGQIMFSLDSPDDLSKLAVGQRVRFNVLLSDSASRQLDWAQARVLYPASRLGVATDDGTVDGVPTVKPGDLLPVPLDAPEDFQSLPPEPGKVEAFFMTLGDSPNSRIAADPTNSTLFSFEVEVLTPGHGSVQFDLLDPDAEFATEYADGKRFNALPVVVSGSLPFFVVPEPSTVALTFASLAMLAWFSRVNAKRKLQNAKCG